MKIMVVEANRAVADHLQRLLSSDRNEIMTVSDGTAAWSKTAAIEGVVPYDLIILNEEAQEPEQGSEQEPDGVNICRCLREKGCQIPILLLLDHASVHQAIAAIEAGADDYLIRPFDDQHLVMRTEFLVHRAQRDWCDRQQIAVQLERERLIAEITDSIRQPLELEKILRVAVDQVRHFLQTDRVIVFRFLSNWQGIVESESVASDWSATIAMQIQDACLGNVYIGEHRQGRVSAIHNVETVAIDPVHRELLKSLQVKANLVVPILQGDNLWGLLIAHHCRAPRQWKTDSTQLLQQVATQMGIAIQQAELYQKTQQQAALIDIATDAIFVRDLAGHILFWSQGAERLYGWTAAEALGNLAQQLLKGKERADLEKALSTTLEQGFWQGELTQSTKAGDSILVASRWTLVKDSANHSHSLLEVNTDITEKKRLEAQFYQVQRLESLGQLAGGIAHDLGNMLTPILGIAQLLRLSQQNGDVATQQQLDLLESSAKRGAEMVRQILTFAQGSPEGARESETAVDIVIVLQEVMDVVRQGFPNSIEIRQNIVHPSVHSASSTPFLKEVSADSTHLHQVLMNLCINARDAMPNGGVLSVAVDNCYVSEATASKNLEAAVGHYIVVRVADTGTGITPEMRDRIFDPFFTTKAPDKGTGLGLSTVSGIVKNAGGFIEVASEVGQGTQISVYLPALKAPTQRS
ncbi:MAG: histidine kinase [Phormidesmis priestleyi]|uniref:histidine kinase n=1 Tax=Phormidesmis priestleyi TaxID=268141 RepID=A0A2W4XMQ3_9CYAN|nr:MAG: histidine kinase [Phormidesmis priestleyi]